MDLYIADAVENSLPNRGINRGARGFQQSLLFLKSHALVAVQYVGLAQQKLLAVSSRFAQSRDELEVKTRI